MIEMKTHARRRRFRRRRRPAVARSARVDVPVLARTSGGPAERLGALVRQGLHPAVVFVVVMLAGLARSRRSRSASGFSSPGCSSPPGASARPTSASTCGSPRIGRRSRRTPRWSARSSPAECAADRRRIASRSSARVLRKWRIAAFVVFALGVESATYRATTLVVHSHRPRVAASREPAGQRQLPVGSHGGIDRGLRRARAAAHVAVHEHASSGGRVDVRSGDRRLRRPGAHVSRHAPPAGRRRRRFRRHRGR